MGNGKCSAGACPPLGSGWGVAESAVPIRYTKPQLRLFIPWRVATGVADCYEIMSRTKIRDSPLQQTLIAIRGNPSSLVRK